MANLIQIKRSATSSSPGSLANGELAFTSNGNVLYIGSPNGSVVGIGGLRTPGVLSANQALVANSTSGINEIRVGVANVGAVFANGSLGQPGQALLSNSTGVYWGDVAVSLAGANTQVQFNDSGVFGASAGFAFNKSTNTLSVGASTINSTSFSGTANNSLNFDGKTSSVYVQTSGNFSLAGNIHFQGANNHFSGPATFAGNTVTVSSNLVVSSANVDMSSAMVRVADLQIFGNLTVAGTMTTINTTSLEVKDPIIKLADGNSNTDTVDIGFFGSSGNATSTWYHGLVRDQSRSTLTASVFRLFSTNTAPTTIVDETAAGYSLGTLEAWVTSGALVSNSINLAITANGTIDVNITANTLSLSSALAASSGGTGRSTIANNALLVGNTSGGYNALALGASGYVLQSNGTALVYDSLDGGTF